MLSYFPTYEKALVSVCEPPEDLTERTGLEIYEKQSCSKLGREMLLDMQVIAAKPEEFYDKYKYIDQFMIT